MIQPILLRLPESLVTALDQEARRSGTSRNKTAQRLLQQALEGTADSRALTRKLLTAALDSV